MEFLQRFELWGLTKKERLAYCESEIAYNKAVIENAKASITRIQKIIDSFETAAQKKSKLNESLCKYLDLIDEHYRDIENSEANLSYYTILRDNLKKELGIQNS